MQQAIAKAPYAQLTRVLGACCSSAYTCRTNVTWAQCTKDGGGWNRRNTCGFCRAPPQVQLGACCTDGNPGECRHVTRAACLNSSNTLDNVIRWSRWIKGKTCSSPCPQSLYKPINRTGVGVHIVISTLRAVKTAYHVTNGLSCYLWATMLPIGSPSCTVVRDTLSSCSTPPHTVAQ